MIVVRRLLLVTTAIAAFAVTVQLIAGAEQIASGPIVLGVPGKTATIAWLIQNGNATVRRFSAPGITSPFRVETTLLTSLQPNTRYEYNISSLGEAGKGSFKTPPSGSEP